MARYYFDTQDGELIRDDVGIECESLDQVRAEALAGLGDFAKDAMLREGLRELSIKVRDDQDRPVLQVKLRLEIS